MSTTSCLNAIYAFSVICLIGGLLFITCNIECTLHVNGVLTGEISVLSFIQSAGFWLLALEGVSLIAFPLFGMVVYAICLLLERKFTGSFIWEKNFYGKLLLITVFCYLSSYTLLNVVP